MRLTFEVRPPQTPPRFTRVYGVGGRGDITSSGDTLRLPLSLLADSVTYIFEQASGRRDTLVLCYTRRIEMLQTCGYTANINGDNFIYGRNDTLQIRELTNLWRRSRTTFSRGRAEYRVPARTLGPLRNSYQVWIEP
jgi:hypothetical protein